MSKNILMIVNPVSGRGILKQRLWKILETFSAANITTNVIFTGKRGDATEIAKTCPDDIETVVCAGGDGTLNEVISGLMENPTPHKLGYIPVGTTNDLATSLGIPKNPIEAAKNIIEGHTEKIDIGSFSGRYFNYVASFGAFTEASYNTTQEAKNILGHFAYVLEGVMSLANIRPYKVKFTFNDTVLEDEFIFGAISNTTSMGGVLKLKDTLVALNDGEFELLVVKTPTNVIQLQKILGEIMTQNFSGDLVKLFHTSHIIVESEEEFDWTLDGECHHGTKKEEIKNISKAIKLIVPSCKS
ncbi:MAG: YegS/Rv2252/BmrU family lipid kinase [Clostridia bacterium]|nr:YegS/Rv2252/BmrU family lipid kinase [Clostridia bacterium]